MCKITNTQLEPFSQNDLWGVKNKSTGEVVCEPKYLKIDEFSYGYAVVYEKNRKGFINKQGKRVFEKYHDVRGFVNGRAAVKHFFDKWGFIDTNGNEIGTNTYHSVSDFNEYGYAVVDNGKGKEIIDKDGKLHFHLSIGDEISILPNGWFGIKQDSKTFNIKFMN